MGGMMPCAVMMKSVESHRNSPNLRDSLRDVNKVWQMGGGLGHYPADVGSAAVRTECLWPSVRPFRRVQPRSGRVRGWRFEQHPGGASSGRNRFAVGATEVRLSQRSRETRQRWAGGHNRFAVGTCSVGREIQSQSRCRLFCVLSDFRESQRERHGELKIARMGFQFLRAS